MQPFRILSNILLLPLKKQPTTTLLATSFQLQPGNLLEMTNLGAPLQRRRISFLEIQPIRHRRRPRARCRIRHSQTDPAMLATGCTQIPPSISSQSLGRKKHNDMECPLTDKRGAISSVTYADWKFPSQRIQTGSAEADHWPGGATQGGSSAKVFLGQGKVWSLTYEHQPQSKHPICRTSAYSLYPYRRGPEEIHIWSCLS